jgi:DNA-binding XRE family transcriptional regulator
MDNLEFDKFLKDLGKSIKEKRMSLKITQQELAYRCDIEKPNIVRIETGRTNPTTKTLKIIAKSLNIKVKDLFDFED